MRHLLRIPLGWKLLAPWLIGAVAVAAWAAAYGAGIGSLPVLGGILALFAGLGIAALRWALQPLRSLTDTARRVTSGDDSARAPRSPLADPRTAQLITTFNEMLDALAMERRRRHDDAAWMVATEERQRERVAAQLHAGPAQTLAGVLVRLRLLERACPPSELEESFTEVVTEVRAALDEIGALARRLRPPELGELGTRAAVQALARRTEVSSAHRVRVTGSIPDARIPPAARAALFRIVEECLLEAESGPDSAPITVEFAASGDTLTTALRLPPGDPSAGTDQALREASPRWRVLGHRAELVGGRLSTEPDATGSTRIRLELPLDPPPGPARADEPWTPPVASGVPLGEG